MTKLQLRKRRKKLGLSQFELSKLSKVSRYNIAIFETGHRKLTTPEEKSIEKVLTKKENIKC